MKHITNILLGFIILVFVYSCSDSAVSQLYIPSLTNKILTVSPSSITFSENGGSKNVMVSTKNTPWVFKGYPSWLTVSPVNGTESTMVTFTADKNISADTTKTCVFYLESTDPDWTYKSYVSVSQEKAEPYINPSERSLVFEAESSEKKITIISNLSWSFVCNDKWLSITREGDVLSISVNENTSGQSRVATIQLIGEKIISTIEVLQQVSGVSCSIDEVNFEREGGTTEVDITAKTSWTAETSNDWITISQMEGELGVSTIQITTTENKTVYNRFGYVYIKVGGNNLCQIKVNQKGEFINTDVSFVEFAPIGEDKTISVNSNTKWKIIHDFSWLNISNVEGNGNCIITLTATNNLSQSSRSGTISLLTESDSKKIDIQIVQYGVSINTDVSTMMFPYSGGTQELGLDVNSDWSIKENETASWLSISPYSGSSSIKSVLVSASENEGEDDRASSVTISSYGFSESVEIIQEGKYFKISDETLTMSASSNNISLSVSTTEEWEATTAYSWISLSQTSGKGNADINISIEKNNSLNTREGSVIFRPADGRQIVLNIKQKGLTVICSPTSFTVNKKGETQYVDVIADGDFNVYTKESWLQIDELSSKGFLVVVTENNETYIDRRGFVYVELVGTSVKKTISITQTVKSEEKEYVDLGLPSGTLWAKTNLGAKTCEQSGIYFQWGGIVGGDENNPCVNIKTSIQGTMYDAAKAIWGDGWVIPNVRQANEIWNYCDLTLIKINGIDCFKITSRRNGNYMYIPKAGYYYSGTGITKGCIYWTSEPNLYFSNSYKQAKYIEFPPGGVDGSSTGISKGALLPIRPVKLK